MEYVAFYLLFYAYRPMNNLTCFSEPLAGLPNCDLQHSPDTQS